MAARTVSNSKQRGKADTRKTPAKKQTRMERFKPHLPYEDFPLFPHQSGRWAKKINGKLHYYGKLADGWEAARDEYDRWREDDYAGRARVDREGTTIKLVCDSYLTFKESQLESGEIKQRTFDEYEASAILVANAFGRRRLVDDLTAADFGKLRAELAKTRGPHTLGNEIQRIRGIFKFAYDDGLIEKPVRYGQQFKKPGAKVIRESRNANGGIQDFTAAELRKIINKTSGPLKAIVLLGINCGFEPHDCGALNQSHIDMKAKAIDFPRPKTSVDRRCPLWPETIVALKEALADRPAAKDDTDSDAVFITKYGRRWVRGKGLNACSGELNKVLEELGLKERGKTFLSFRHTFRTHAGETGDIEAVDRIMGHEPGRGTSAAYYIGLMDDERLRKVSNHVRKWLFGKSHKG